MTAKCSRHSAWFHRVYTESKTCLVEGSMCLHSRRSGTVLSVSHPRFESAQTPKHKFDCSYTRKTEENRLESIVEKHRKTLKCNDKIVKMCVQM